MPNTIQTNSLTTLITLRAAEAAPYFTVGSKKYFKDQLVGKRNGEKYTFVVRDTGGAYEGEAVSTGDKTSISERAVELTIRNFRVMVETRVIEETASLDWDPEIAAPNGQKLINKAVKSIMDSDFGKVGTAFIGSGFAPLSRASAHLASITNEDLFGFVDPNVEAILTSNGQQFVPVDAPDMYRKGLLGKFHGAEYRAQRFFPSVTISATAKTQYDAATITSYTSGTSYDTMVLGASTLTAGIKKGTPIFVEGVYACDTVGDPTSMLHAFIVLEDATPSSNSVSVKVAKVDFANSTRDIAKEDGSAWSAATLASQAVSIPEAGTYFMGIVRANGAFEFETLDKIDCAGADYEKSPNIEGLTIHQNRLVDVAAFTNKTRWDMPTLAGTVEPRAVAMVLVK